MKSISILPILTALTFTITFLSLTSSTYGRDLTYKIGAGYRQAYSNAAVDDKTGASAPVHLNGIEASYGIAKDLQVEAYFGFTRNFGFVMVGPELRYDLQRLFSRDFAAWQYLNIFAEAAFFTKLGNSSKTGIVLKLPYAGFEVMPFANNNFAISASAGLVLDFVSKNKVGFTQGLLGDLGVKYYF